MAVVVLFANFSPNKTTTGTQPAGLGKTPNLVPGYPLLNPEPDAGFLLKNPETDAANPASDAENPELGAENPELGAPNPLVIRENPLAEPTREGSYSKRRRARIQRLTCVANSAWSLWPDSWMVSPVVRLIVMLVMCSLPLACSSILDMGTQ